MTAGIMVNEHKMLEDTNKIFEELGILLVVFMYKYVLLIMEWTYDEEHLKKFNRD